MKKEGRKFFRIKLAGYEDPTLEPAGKFFMRFSGTLIKNGLEHNVAMYIFKELEGVPCE